MIRGMLPSVGDTSTPALIARLKRDSSNSRLQRQGWRQTSGNLHWLTIHLRESKAAITCELSLPQA
jgi:hypothetical protein